MSWLAILRQQVKDQGQRKVADAMGVSTTVISQVCNEKYPGDMQRIQALVESVFLSKTVQCPVLGEIPWHKCHRHQQNEHTSNPQKLRLYRACRSGCENSELPTTHIIKIQVNENRPDAVSQYDAEAVINRMKRQAAADANTLIELLQSELIHLAARFNRLNRGAK